MSHVDFKNRQCRPVEFKGQVPPLLCSICYVSPEDRAIWPELIVISANKRPQTRPQEQVAFELWNNEVWEEIEGCLDTYILVNFSILAKQY